MAVRNITIFLTGDATSLTTTLRATAAQLDRFVAETEAKGTASGSAFATGLGKAAGVAGIALVGALTAAGVAAAGFEERMRNVNSIALESEGQFQSTEKSVLDLSRSLPQSANTLAEGLYNIESSGFKGADALNVLAQSGKAASAGLSETDVASRAITGALNAYGLSAASAKDVSDILFKTVDFGIVTFQEAAQNLGDFVGTAAAAKVPLGDVAAAFATVTRSGIPAAEAATSINQLLTQLLRPSKNLAEVYKELGYQSGAAALEQKGLAGVVQDLGRVTGGSADQVVKLFGRVESSKALFGLLAGGGKTYADALKEVADRSGYAGSTQKAFAEQMKSTSAQLKVNLNDLQATAITIGLQLLPPFVQFLKLAHEVGGDAVPYIESAFRAVLPVMQQVWQIAGDVVSILGQLQQGAAPVEQALLKIAGAAVLGPLKAFLSVLQAVTSFLSQHAGVVQAVAAIIATRFVFSMLSAVGATIAFNVRAALTIASMAGIGSASEAAAVGIGAASAGMRGLLGSLVSFQAVATVGVAGALFALTRGLQQWNEAQDQAKSNADETRKSFDAYDTAKARQQLDQLRQTAQHGIDVGKQYDGVWGTLKAGFSEVAGDGSVGKVAAQGEAAANAYNDLNAKLQATDENLRAVAKASGLSVEALKLIAQQQNIDLSGPFAKSADARAQLLKYTKDLDKESNRAAVSIAQSVGMDIDAYKALEAQVQAVVDATDKAFKQDTDVLGGYSPQKYADAVAQAEERLAKARKDSGGSATSSLKDEQALASARQRVSDAEARAAASSSKTAESKLSHDQSIARARKALQDLEARQAEKAGTSGAGDGQAVADAQAALTAARADQAKHTLQNEYRDRIREAQQFTVSINQAIQRGLDPQYVAKLLQEGPAKALPVLQTLLRDHSNRLIRTTNESERKLSEINQYALEQARIIAQAVNSSDTFFIKHTREAMAIAAAEAASGGKKTAAQLARALNVPESEIREVATKFGLTLAADVQDAVDRNPIVVKLRGQATAKRLDARDARQGYAAGGLVPSVPAPRRYAAGGLVQSGQGTHRSADGGVVPSVASLRRYAAGGLVQAAAPRFGPPRYDAPSFTAPSFTAPSFTAPEHAAPSFAAPSFTAPQFDAPSFDAPRHDPPQYDAPSFDAPRFEAPRFEAPRFEAPRFEAPRFEAPRYDVGGLVQGAPAYLGDVIPALLMGNEYVQPTHVVNHYGVDAMDALRSLTVPREALRGFSDGGLASRDGSWTAAMGRQPDLRVVPVPIRSSSSIDNSTTYNVGTVQASSPAQLPAWGPRRYSGTRGVG